MMITTASKALSKMATLRACPWLLLTFIFLGILPFTVNSSFFSLKRNAPKSSPRRGWGLDNKEKGTTQSYPSSLTDDLNNSSSKEINTTNQTEIPRNPTNSSIVPKWKQSLPEPLNRRSTLQRILVPTSPNTHVQIYLLGTSHVSNDSSADVRLLLRHVQPHVVFVELCSQRIGMLEASPTVVAADSATAAEAAAKNHRFWDRVAQVQENSHLSRLSAISTVLLTSVQQNYADSLGVELGSEFHQAYSYVTQHRPLLILGDRPLQITLLRAWETLSLVERVKVMLGLLWSSWRRPNVEELRAWMQRILEHEDLDVLSESMKELGQQFPSLERVILKERDAYMACKLHQMCQMLPRGQNLTCVAIVGAGHCRGIVDWLTNQNGLTPEQVLEGLVETKKFQKDDVQSLVTHVTELPMVESTAATVGEAVVV